MSWRNNEMPSLVDDNFFIPPPDGAVSGGHPGLHDAFPGAQNAFPGAQNAFPAAQHAFPGTRNAFPGAQSAFLGAQDAFSGVQSAFPSLQSRRPSNPYPPNGDTTVFNTNLNAQPFFGLPASAPATANSWTYGQYNPSPQPANQSLWNTPWANTAQPMRQTSISPSTPMDSVGFSSLAWRPPDTFAQEGSSWSTAGRSAQPLGGGFFGQGSNPDTPGVQQSPWSTSQGGQHSMRMEATSPRGDGTVFRINRSNSQTGRERKSSLKYGGVRRANSFNGQVNNSNLDWNQPSEVNNDYQRPQRSKLGRTNLARRPRDWRADYSPRGGILSMVSMVGRNRSDVKEISDNVRRTLHPLIAYVVNKAPMYLDLRDELADNLYFPYLSRPHNSLDFAQLATSPAINHIRLYHARLPWYVDVVESQGNGVTIGDVVSQLHEQLAGRRGQISDNHFWNEEITDTERHGLTEAYRRRCGPNYDLRTAGVMKVDFLGMEDRYVLLGFVRGKNGMWEMKLKKGD